ncbi:MAG: MerR family transcriptional regulator [Pseudomonadota bacterium]
MNIGTLAKESGLAQSRIRYYEAQGLLGAVKRGANGYRVYGSDAAYLLGIITTAQEAGFSLDEIRNLLPQSEAAGWDVPKLTASLRAKLTDIIALQARLARSQADIEAMLVCIERGDHAPPP